MNFTSPAIPPTIIIITADSSVARGCIEELTVFGGRYRTVVVTSIEQAHARFLRTRPSVLFLDESAIDLSLGFESLESAVALLIETAPVVVAAAPETQSSLGFLIESGALDFVVRSGSFVPIVAGMLNRRAQIAERMAGMIQFPSDELAGDFGEILRHEVNNPLTGILGNTELLLARRDGLPPGTVERLKTIAELAVRLRETVRRLSNAWDEHHEPVRPA
jgi:signal transduction histidine kinase